MTFQAQPQCSSRLLTAELNWFRLQGVDLFALIRPTTIYCVNGIRSDKGRMTEAANGQRWFAVPEADEDGANLDTCYFSTRNDDIAVDTARAFCLEQWRVDAVSTYALDGALRIFASPLQWLQAGRKGIVVLRWEFAFDRLRDCPRIVLPLSLHETYKRHMRPKRMPKLMLEMQQ